MVQKILIGEGGIPASQPIPASKTQKKPQNSLFLIQISAKSASVTGFI